MARWCWGYLGCQVRVPLPSCAVTMDRATFPSDSYTGFRKPSHHDHLLALLTCRLYRLFITFSKWHFSANLLQHRNTIMVTSYLHSICWLFWEYFTYGVSKFHNNPFSWLSYMWILPWLLHVVCLRNSDWKKADCYVLFIFW